jgi:uncharacterized membrane protein
LVLLVLSLAAVAIRHYFNIRHLPGFRAWPLIPAALLLAGLIIATAPEPRPVYQTGEATTAVTTSEIFTIVQQRCIKCHAPVPDFEAFTSAPLGVELDSQQKLLQHAERVYQTVAVTRTMPLGNLTQITDTERKQFASWFESLDNKP